eukprot:1872321-Prymnesium_polylepis.1
MTGNMQSLHKDVRGIKEAQTGLERKVSGFKSSSETKTCFNCGAEGHFSWNCPHEKKDNTSKAKKTKAEAGGKEE